MGAAQSTVRSTATIRRERSKQARPRQASAAEALFTAAWRGDAESVRLLLLRAPGCASTPSPFGWTALHAATARPRSQPGGKPCDHPAVVRLLLEAAPAAATAAAPFGGLPLHYAVRWSEVEVISFILEAAPTAASATHTYVCHRAEVETQGVYALHLAALRGSAEKVALLLDAAPFVATTGDELGQLPAHYAARGGNAAGLRELLRAAPEAAMTADRGGWLPCHCAARQGSAGPMQVLLEMQPAAAAAADAGGITPLHLAAEFASVDAVKLLLAAAPQAAAAPDAAGSLPCHYASKRQCASPEVVLRLLQAAPSATTVRDSSGRLPLQWALARAAECWRLSTGGQFPVRPQQRVSFCSNAAAHIRAARLLLEGVPAADAAAALAEAGEVALPLWPALVASQPLSPRKWRRVPVGCPGLGAVLPAVLARSESEAGCLVAHLSPAERERVQALAMCLARVSKQMGASIPASAVRSMLALSCG